MQSGRYTAGVATRYAPSTLTGAASTSTSAEGFTIGMRFHSAPVAAPRRRQAGAARSLPLALTAAWRHLRLRRRRRPERLGFTPAGAVRAPRHRPIAGATRRRAPTSTASFDVRAVFQQHHRDLAVEDLPSLLLPRKGRYGLVDYEKAFTPDLDNRRRTSSTCAASTARGARGRRPARPVRRNVLPLDAYDELAEFFGRVPA